MAKKQKKRTLSAAQRKKLVARAKRQPRYKRSTKSHKRGQFKARR